MYCSSLVHQQCVAVLWYTNEAVVQQHLYKARTYIGNTWAEKAIRICMSLPPCLFSHAACAEHSYWSTSTTALAVLETAADIYSRFIRYPPLASGGTRPSFHYRPCRPGVMGRSFVHVPYNIFLIILTGGWRTLPLQVPGTLETVRAT